MVNKIDGIDVNFSGESPTLIVHNLDQPGHVAEVTSMLAHKSVNIATMQLYRERRGEYAVMVIETDQPIPDNAIAWLEHLEGICLLYTSSTTALITALGMSLVLENGALVIFGSAPRNVPPMFDLPAVSFGSVTIPATTILTLVIGLVMMLLLTLFIRYTKLGKAMRAVPEDKIASTLVGINVNKIITATFAIGSGLAAVASMMYTTSYVSIKNERCV